jgi:hypothetical protein
MARLELLFGTARRSGPPVTPGQWRRFVDREVTPRFPQGLTIFEGRGQWRTPTGRIRKEATRLLLIWYTPDAGSEKAIAAVRDAYRARFRQDSVMRVDGWSCVSF